MIKNYLLVGFCLLATPALHAATVSDLKGWTVQGDAQVDPSKAGPDGAPSIKLGPGSEATLPLGAANTSGKITFSVYDDATVAEPDQKKVPGPRWGVTQANGHVFVAGVMYAKFLKPEGSICLFDVDPKDKGSWGTMKFAGARGAAGWKKWEIEFDPSGALKISVDGAPMAAKYIEGATPATGFNGIALFGDGTKSSTPQTVWISGLTYEQGAAAAASSAPAAAGAAPTSTTPGTPPAAPAPVVAIVPPANAPPPAADTDGSSVPAPAMTSPPPYVPGPALADDEKSSNIVPPPGYLAHHPRLLFSASDKAALQQKAKDNPQMWEAVLQNTAQLNGVPTPDMIKNGVKYWRIRSVESAALAWFVTGDDKYFNLALPWMVTYCQQPIWGTGFRDNMDLQASWNTYYLSVAYDVFYSKLSDADRKTIRDGLASHAKVLYDSFNSATGKLSYDQNHCYNPAVALTAASLVLYGNVPDAAQWLNRAHVIMQRSRYVQNEDGYYYEGFGYWVYALHWHARYADLMARATGEKLYDIPFLRDDWRFALYLSLPGIPGSYDVGDSYFWKEGGRPMLDINNYALLWDMAGQNHTPESRTVADMYYQRHPDVDEPASGFLWFPSDVKPVDLSQIPTYHYFPDMDVVSWRSSWKADATCYLFRCGPPLGHKALAKIDQLKDWEMNTGHVHADIGSFLMFGKGAYLAVGTGYTAEKWTRDHNTLLVDGKGQASDGEYHNARGVPYQDLDQVRIDKQYLTDSYGFATGEMGTSYNHNVPGGVKLRRSLLMTAKWMLMVDDMSSDQDHKLTWLCHTEGAFQADGTSFVAKLPTAALGVVPLSTDAVTPEMGPTTVMAGNKPGGGKPEQHGFQLSLTQAQPGKTMRIINLLVPLGTDEKLPTAQLIKQDKDSVQFSLKWPDGKTEQVNLNLAWQQAAAPAPGPADIKTP